MGRTMPSRRSLRGFRPPSHPRVPRSWARQAGEPQGLAGHQGRQGDLPTSVRTPVLAGFDRIIREATAFVARPSDSLSRYAHEPQLG